ncbi:hypothetical protein HanPSC8_Chr03g0129701 [Helianthus annuus]|nr:hypothetical protein HanPSC8_Chr03g0129701 [Helianthus annuus]
MMLMRSFSPETKTMMKQTSARIYVRLKCQEERERWIFDYFSQVHLMRKTT